jgi:hypothetical protein
MSQKLSAAIAVIGIDIGKNSFHLVGHDPRGAIVLRQKWSRGQVETRLANLPPCLIGMRPASARIISVESSKCLATMPCAYRKSNPDIFVVQSAEDWAAKNSPCPLHGA